MWDYLIIFYNKQKVLENFLYPASKQYIDGHTYAV